MKNESNQIPVWAKANLTLTEASEYFGIGVNKIRELTDGDNSPYVLWVGRKRLIKREKFGQFLADAFSV